MADASIAVIHSTRNSQKNTSYVGIDTTRVFGRKPVEVAFCEQLACKKCATPGEPRAGETLAEAARRQLCVSAPNGRLRCVNLLTARVAQQNRIEFQTKRRLAASLIDFHYTPEAIGMRLTKQRTKCR
jgi:hypothetical protein